MNQEQIFFSLFFQKKLGRSDDVKQNIYSMGMALVI